MQDEEDVQPAAPPPAPVAPPAQAPPPPIRMGLPAPPQTAAPYGQTVVVPTAQEYIQQQQDRKELQYFKNVYQNAQNFEQAQKDVAGARRMLGMLKADREVKSGVPIEKAMWNNMQYFMQPEDIARNFKTFMPPPTPQVRQFPGTTIPAGVQVGQQFHWPPQPRATPAAIGEAEAITRKMGEAAAAEKAGNTELANNLRREAGLIESRLVPPSETVEVTPEGVKITKGGKSGGSDQPTTAFKTKLQEQLHGYDDAMSILNHISQNATASDFGVRGVGKEMWTRIGGQLGANVDPDAMDVRKSIGLLRASLYKTLRSDSNIDIREREQIEKMLPSESIMESLPDAVASLNAVKRRLIDVSRTNAGKLKTLPPVWSMTPEEKDRAIAIRASYKAGKITQEQAIKALNAVFGM